MDLEQRMAAYQAFLKNVEQLKEQYAHTHDPEDLADGIRRLSADSACHPYADHLLLLGDSYMESGDSAAGLL